MLFEQRLRDGIANDTVTVAYRRWRRPQVVAGHRYRTGYSMIEVESVDVVEPADIAADDARRAGFDTVATAVADLRGDADLPVYRVVFRRVPGPDPRDVLAERGDLDDADLHTLSRRLDRMDAASATGPWTAETLDAIAGHPGVRAADLAARLGRETAPFKVNVRKLKALGLTISLEKGYRLSPRGVAFLRARGFAPRSPS